MIDEEDFDDDYVSDSTDIDENNLNQEYCRVSADLAYWNEEHAKATRRALLAKAERDRVHARIWSEKRAESKLEGQKLTEKDIQALIAQDDEYFEAYSKWAEAEAAKTRLRGYCEAVSTKKDMLQSLGANIRAEFQDPQVRSEKREDRFHKQWDDAVRGNNDDDDED